jgi:hypothetical protein
MLATCSNVIGAAKNRRGAKLAKDRLTIGITWNATGEDFWKPVFIGKAKKPRCFGNHWSPENIGSLYYYNNKAWMRNDVWWDYNRKFNRYGIAHLRIPLPPIDDSRLLYTVSSPFIITVTRLISLPIYDAPSSLLEP